MWIVEDDIFSIQILKSITVVDDDDELELCAI